MGKVHFKSPGPVEIPYTARTGQTVDFKAYVVNDNMPIIPTLVPDCVHSKIVVEIATDPQGKNIVGKAELEFDACCLNWSGEVTTIDGQIIMPSYDIWLGFFLYQFMEDKWVLVDSTVFFAVDNPEWPPPLWGFWTWKFLGIELYKWAIIWLSVTLAGVIIVKARS
jgi:hypothetical protein